MATIVTRAGKGSPLTHAEVDANFSNLNSDKVESSALGTAAYTASTDYATAAQGTNADTAYGWGDHASGGYLSVSGSPTDGQVLTYDTINGWQAETLTAATTDEALALAIALG